MKVARFAEADFACGIWSVMEFVAELEAGTEAGFTVVVVCAKAPEPKTLLAANAIALTTKLVF